MADGEPEPGEHSGPNLAAPFQRAEQLTEETAQRLLSFFEKTAPVKRLRGSQIASAVLGSIGFALFVVGVERAAENVPIISNAYGSIGVGLVLLIATGVLLQRLGGGGGH